MIWWVSWTQSVHTRNPWDQLRGQLHSFNNVYVVVQFYPWFKIYFLLFETNYHVIIIRCHTQEQKKIIFEGRIKLNHNIYIEDITRWREDMNFIFEWINNILRTSAASEIKYCFCHKKIKFISWSHGVIFFLLHRQKDIDKIIDFYLPKSNCEGPNLQYSNII